MTNVFLARTFILFEMIFAYVMVSGVSERSVSELTLVGCIVF